MKNNHLTQKIRRIKNKIILVENHGGCCKICKNNNFISLCFHHLNGEKEFQISDKSSCSLTKMLEESKKCELLCQNCHRELHYCEKNVDVRRTDKILYLEYGGGKCKKCGYNKCPVPLTFHHRDPNQKEFWIGGLSERINSISELDEKIKNEIDKCDILCANCHVIEHFDMKFYLDNFQIIKNYKIKKISKKVDRETIFKMHKDGFTHKKISQVLGCAPSTISDIIRGRKY